MEALAQRAILTVVSEVRLVDTDYDVLSATVGSVVMTDLCSTAILADGSARLRLVLHERDDVHYGQTVGCIAARIAELECMTGRSDAKSQRRCSSSNIRAAVVVVVGAEQKEVAASSVSPSTLHTSLGHLSATDRMLGVRDLRRASLEQRVNLLLALGKEEQHAPWLSEPMASIRPGTAPPLLAIEELGTMAIDEHCCATGCEPCVWETYYKQQSCTRRDRAAAAAAAGAPEAAGEYRKRGRAETAAADEASDGAADESTEWPAGDVAAHPPRLVPERMVTISLLERQQHTEDMLLLTFGANLSAGSGVGGGAMTPWHVRLRLRDLAGIEVTRPYTALRCADGRLELIVKVPSMSRFHCPPEQPLAQSLPQPRPQPLPQPRP